MIQCEPKTLTLELLSDTTLSRGEGTPGIVDVEVEHDEWGIPFVGGKTLRGLLRDTWLSMQHHFPELNEAAFRVFGPPEDFEEKSILRISDATIEESARRYFIAAVDRGKKEREKERGIDAGTVLEALTDIREQTAEDRRSGAPARKTLRSVRVAVRGLRLAANLNWTSPPTSEDRQCLALAVLGTRHAGLGRNRGRGYLCLTLDGDRDKTLHWARGDR